MPKVVSLDKAPMTELTWYGSEERHEMTCLGTISVPVRDHINAATATSLIHTDWKFIQPDRYIDRQFVQGSILTLQRNEAIARMRGDWLMFIDDDMVWDPEAIGKLLASRNEVDADIMGALCYRRSAPHQPTLFMREEQNRGGYNYLEDWPSDIMEVDATGMAFVVIHKRVFEKMAGEPFPPYEIRRAGEPPSFFRWEGVLGEDLRFCQDAKAVGCRIFVDTRIEVGHMAEVEIRRKHYLLEVLGRDDDTQRQREAINDRMGLPTLTKEQAKELLGW